MSIQVFSVFFKTALYACRLVGKSEASRIDLKRQWAEMVLKTFGFSLEVQGTPPNSGARIFVGNHISYLDIPVLMAAMPEITFIAKDDLKKWPIIGTGASAVGTIFVNRRSGNDRKVVRDQVVKILNDQNRSVAIFPSGTTTLHEEAPWKRGAFEIAKAAEVPIHLFRIDYKPLRASAYIGDDNLLLSMLRLSNIRNKSVSIRWLEHFDQIDDPSVFSERLRQKVVVSSQCERLLNEA